MPNMKPFEVKNFSGGITDDYIDAEGNKCKTCDNLDISIDGKLQSRDGSAVLNPTSAQVPQGENRINKIIEKTDTNDIFVFADDDVSYLESGTTTWKNAELKMAIDDIVQFISLFTTHCFNTGLHTNADSTNAIFIDSYSVSVASLISLVSEAIEGYNAHQQDAVAGGANAYHTTDETIENTLVSTVDPVTYQECLDRIADLRDKFNAHKIESNAHMNVSTSTGKKFLSTITEKNVLDVEEENISYDTWKDFIFFTTDDRINPKKIYKKDLYRYIHSSYYGFHHSQAGEYLDKDMLRMDDTTLSITKIKYLNGMFVAIGGQNASLFHSLDGKVWEENTNFATSWTETVHDIDYSEEQDLWVAVGTKNSGGTYGKVFYTSDIDGSWTEATCNIESRIFGVKYIKHLDKWICCGGSNKVAYSSDGITWEVVGSVLTDADNIRGIAYNGVDTVIVIGVKSGDGIYVSYSNDLATWTTGGPSGGSAGDVLEGTGIYQPEYTTTFGNGIFITGGLANGIIHYSIDNGVIWNSVDIGFSTQVYSIFFDDLENKFIAFSETVASKVASSINAIDWIISHDINSIIIQSTTQGKVRGDYVCETIGLPPITQQLNISSAGGTGDYFIYAFIRCHKYFIGDTEYLMQSSAKYQSISNVGAPETNNITISNIPVLENNYKDSVKYPVNDIYTEVYRTVDNGSVFYLVGSVQNGNISIIDSISDSDLILKRELYTTGGILDNDMPPKCKFLHINNNVAYYANVEENGIINSSRIRLSVNNDPDSCPATNYVDVGDEITGINSLYDTVIVFCKNSIYRIEGYFDELGEGIVSPINIDKTIGCISNNSIVSTPVGVFFAGTDGFYYTDGYKIIKISNDIDKTYKLLTVTNEQKLRISGAYNKINRTVIWTVQESGQTDCNKCFVLDLKQGINDSMPFVTYSGTSFKPTTLTYLENHDILRGDTRGYILKHNDTYKSDIKISTLISPANWEKETIIYNYISAASSFGTTFVRKWITKILFTARRLTDLFVSIISYNDLATSGDKVKTCSEIKHTDSGELIEKKRFFPSGNDHHRCSYKQIGITNAYSAIYESSNYSNGIVNKTAKTVTLVSGSFPTDIVDYYISFEDDSYDTQFLISSVAAGVINVIDGSAVLPVNGTYAWKIKGYAKDQQISIDSYCIHYDYLTASQDDNISG